MSASWLLEEQASSAPCCAVGGPSWRGHECAGSVLILYRWPESNWLQGVSEEARRFLIAQGSQRATLWRSQDLQGKESKLASDGSARMGAQCVVLV